jgi:UDPglucose 6-dehydrogenase
MGWEVIGTDANSEKTRMIRSGVVPFYEPGVEDLLHRQLEGGTFKVVEDVSEAVQKSSVLFLCVGTPQSNDGRADLRDIEALARLIARNLNGYKLIIEKSTVPIVTARWIEKTIHRYSTGNNGTNSNQIHPLQDQFVGGKAIDKNRPAVRRFEVASNPEFLQEGKAIEGLFHPSRIICGAESEQARAILGRIYEPFSAPILFTDLNTSELIKHAANAFLCTKISFINMVANLCEAVDADITAVAQGIGLDPRIGRPFFEAGIGFGGYCFPKDLRAFIRMAEENGADFSLLNEVERVNRERVDAFVEKVRQAVWVINGKTLAVLGLSFKPGTDDIREAPSVKIIQILLAEGAKLRLFDPQAMTNARAIIPAESGRVTYCTSPYEAVEGAEALLILTEWPEFLELDLAKLQRHMVVPVLIDGRNAIDPARASEAGFEYFGIGRTSLASERKPEFTVESNRADGGQKRSNPGCLEVSESRPRSLVTGGAGFLGSHICDRLLDEGHEVICCDNILTGALQSIGHLRNHPRFAFIRQDVANAMDPPLMLRRRAEWWGREVRLINRLDHIFHCASPASPKHYALYPLPTLRVGAVGTWNALELARVTGAAFLLASTSEVYGDPEINPQVETYWGRVNPVGPRSVYDEAKRYAEALTIAYGKQHGVRVHIARIFNTYGERMREDDGRALPNFMLQALRGEPLTVYGDGSQTRSLCYVSDTVEGLLRLMFSDEVGPVNIGNPEEISMKELAEEIIRVAESTSAIRFEPLPQDDPTRRCPDISKAISLLGWRPQVTLRNGLRRVIPYFRSRAVGRDERLLISSPTLV